jgi:hypothetical protein
MYTPDLSVSNQKESRQRRLAILKRSKTSTTILSPQKITNAVSPGQTCALLFTLNEVAKYMKLGPHPRFKEQPPLAEDLRKKISQTALHNWLKKISRWSGPSGPNAKVECLIANHG